jgi:pyrroloquinoline quinone biosynthesis protein A
MDVALMTMRLRSANACAIAEQRSAITNYANPQGGDMNWTTPAYTELRLGFEITMYIANR